LDRKLDVKINYEINQIEKELEKIRPLIEKCRIEIPDYIELAALSAVLHSFYTGVESIFVMTEKHYENALPKTSNWHKMLLEGASRPKGAREPLISEGTEVLLLEYLQFRHFFRHSYGFSLDWKKIEQLIFNLDENWKRVKDDFRNFLEKGISRG